MAQKAKKMLLKIMN